jgi:hypothetical protein
MCPCNDLNRKSGARFNGLQSGLFRAKANILYVTARNYARKIFKLAKTLAQRVTVQQKGCAKY